MMLKSKFRSKYEFSGRRKNKRLEKRKGQQESDNNSIQVGPVARKSTPARKFDLFGIYIG